MIQWQDLHHSELTIQSLYALLKLRCEVFVVEQTCPYQDIDGDDLVGETVGIGVDAFQVGFFHAGHVGGKIGA